eukprot:COSAG02_NODE_1361_length_13053_cov_26.443956_2_plen_172_part_00
MCRRRVTLRWCKQNGESARWCKVVGILTGGPNFTIYPGACGILPRHSLKYVCGSTHISLRRWCKVVGILTGGPNFTIYPGACGILPWHSLKYVCGSTRISLRVRGWKSAGRSSPMLKYTGEILHIITYTVQTADSVVEPQTFHPGRALPGAVCPTSPSDLSVQSGGPSVEH